MWACKTISHAGRGERQSLMASLPPQLHGDRVIGKDMARSTSPAAPLSCRLGDARWVQRVDYQKQQRWGLGLWGAPSCMEQNESVLNWFSVFPMVTAILWNHHHPSPSPQSQGYLQYRSGWQLNLWKQIDLLQGTLPNSWNWRGVCWVIHGASCVKSRGQSHSCGHL